MSLSFSSRFFDGQETLTALFAVVVGLIIDRAWGGGDLSTVFMLGVGLESKYVSIKSFNGETKLTHVEPDIIMPLFHWCFSS